jgi:hypothetical protein
MISLGQVYLRRKFAFSKHLEDVDSRPRRLLGKFPRRKHGWLSGRLVSYIGDAYITDEGQANLITSELIEPKLYDGQSTHALTLDIDHPALMIQSRTPGHYHLYIDHPMPWTDYVEVLHVLGKVGILQKGYVDASINQGRTALRKSRWDLHWGKIRDALSDLEDL